MQLWQLITFTKVAFTLIRVPALVPVRVTRTSEARTSRAVTVSCTSTKTSNSVAIKTLATNTLRAVTRNSATAERQRVSYTVFLGSLTDRALH